MDTRRLVALTAMTLALACFAGGAGAQEPSSSSRPGSAAHQADVAEIGAKLSNPVSDVWALFTEFDLYFSDGDLNRGAPEVGGRMIFQPVLPFPLYGSGENEWKLITRPTIPILFSQPVPTGLNDFGHEGGLAYYFGIGSRGDRKSSVRDASYLNLLYFAVLNLPDAWQVGMNPTITYDHRASSGNKWDVPIGLLVAKTTKLSGMPVKFELGVEYSVVSPDSFGQRAQIKLNVIPVIPSLVRKPLLGER